MIQDREITKAVSKIRQRAERQSDIQKLLESYVDSGIVPQLQNENHQILYGRRGTGKTHIFQVLRNSFEQESCCVAYIDCRTLGSSSQFTDRDQPISRRCLALFRDILSPIYNLMLEDIIEYSPQEGEKALDAIDELMKAITEPFRIFETKEVEISESEESEAKVGANATVDFVKSAFRTGLDVSESAKTARQQSKKLAVTTEDKIIFPAIHHFLTESLRFSGFKLVILLDEWSSLPRDIQPYLAEFLKRGVLPVTDATLKIAAIEQRSLFSIAKHHDIIGFELGADISMTQDLDDIYVYDRNPESISTFYGDIIMKHLEIELPDNYLKDNFKITKGSDLMSKMFTEKKTFFELSRAAEGVIRDLINIFTISFFYAQKRSRTTIDKKSVLESARQWFEQDKAQHLDETMQTSLRRIIEEVIGNKNSRSFLLPRDLEKHPMILKLFDGRVIHHMQRGYADKDNPGVRYNIYNLVHQPVN
jgi:DNA polymerase III delta prime subunit